MDKIPFKSKSKPKLPKKTPEQIIDRILVKID